MAILDLATSSLDRFKRLVGLSASQPIDILDSPDRRKQLAGSTSTADEEIPDHKRRKLTLTTRYVHRNFAIAAWMIRKHLDFVANHNFEPHTKDPGLNRELENLMNWWSRPENCDVAGRHSFRKMIRLAEACRMVDGDLMLGKISSGKLQAIEGDRIKTPFGDASHLAAGRRIINGVEVNKSGRPLAYAVHHRRDTGGGLEFERWVPARHMLQHGWFDRFDQLRGVSPIVAGLANLQDTYEGIEYSLSKLKVAQLFGISFYRDAIDTVDFGEGAEEDDPDGEDGPKPPRYDVKLGTRPLVLDLEPGDRAEFLENKTPATETQAFLQMVIQIAMKSLDLPYSFYDESFTNFHGSIAAKIQYIHSAKSKRADVQDLLRKITLWLFSVWIQDGLLTPGNSFQTIEDLAFEWIPDGLPWYRPMEELSTDIKAIDAKLKSRDEVSRERFGVSYRDKAMRIKQEEEFLTEIGLTPTVGMISVAPAAPDPDDAAASPAGVELESEQIRQQMELFGNGVRSGSITPTVEDENFFRGRLGLPELTDDAKAVWTNEPTRRPVTLSPPRENHGEEEPPTPQTAGVAVADPEEEGGDDAEEE